jgi:predicted CxxxxCH...CXXCH cytochrome family protein
MRVLVIALLAAVAVMEPHWAALAADPPHDISNGYSCSNCHTVHLSLGSGGYNNICLNCHRPGDPKAGGLPFTPADAANPFKTFTSALPGKMYQTSHNWNGSDNVPAAGALPPLNPSLNGLMTSGTIACSRCHNQHSEAIRPFLRIANDRDQLCLDCHRVRNSTNHMTGTHPVNFNYTSASSAVKAKPAAYYNPPQNVNPGNPTSAMKLVGGTVLCTTCHGVHYTDSSSITFHNHSGYSKLLPSSGYLLRTDLRGMSADALNICTNCHVKRAHNGRRQNVQCTDCHGAHVDTADGTAPNIWLVRRYMNVSSAAGAVRNKPVFFQYTSRPYKSADGTGVCQACHAVPTGPSFPAQHSLTTAYASTCNVCHSHDNPLGSFSASAGSCTACHGDPPQQNVAGGPSGYAANYASQSSFTDESRTPHVSHAGGAPYSYGCPQCHQGNSHMRGTFQDVFLDKTGLIAGASATYDPATRSCASVYCHSNGAPRNGTVAYKSVSWPNGKGTLIGSAGECAQCHEARPTTNAHSKHLSKGYGCVTCHAATVSSDTVISDRARHADGVKSVSFNPVDPLATGTIWTDTAATCTTSACHGDGRGGVPVITPNWLNSATGACGSCHAAAPATFAHGTHFSGTYGPKFGTAAPGSCQNCHAYTTDTAATHVNGKVDIVFASDCTPCHPTGSGTVWTSTTRLACLSCHSAIPSVINGISAPYKAAFSSSGHGVYATACTDCHDQSSAHISTALGTYMRLGTYDTNINGLCNTCHTDPTKVITPSRLNVTTHVLTLGGGPAGACTLCHDPHGTTNLSMVKTTINGTAIAFTNTSSGFVKTTAPYNGLCQVCHTQTTHYRSGAAPDVHPTKFCLSCHSHKGTFAFQPSGNCNSCHGYPPVPAGFVGRHGNYSSARMEDYSGGGGAHTIARHLKPTAMPSEGWANCAVCHSNGVASPATHTMVLPVTPSKITIDLVDRLKFNADLPLGSGQYSGVLRDGGANATGSCSNVKCHFKPSKKWSPVK